MSAAPTNQLFPYTNKIRWHRLYNSGVLGTSVAQCRHPGGRPLRCRIRHLRPSAPDTRISRFTCRVLQRHSHPDPDCCGVLWLRDRQFNVVRSCAQNHFGGRGARRLGRGSNCRKRSGGRAFPAARQCGRSSRVLDRGIGKSGAHIGTERPRLGRRVVEFVSAGDADHVRGVRALARWADIERALHGGGGCGYARTAGRDHVAGRWIMGALWRLFAFGFACHRRHLGPGRELGAFDPKSCYAGWMVIQG